VNGWRCKFVEWGIPFSIYKHTDGLDFPDLDSSVGQAGPDALTEWFAKNGDGTPKHPDNIFALYGIRPDCPLVMSFQSGKFNASGIELDNTAFKTLMGEGTNVGNEGGWIGYMQGLGSPDKDIYSTFLYSVFNPDQGPGDAPKPPCNNVNAASVTSSVMNGGFTAGFAYGGGAAIAGAEAMAGPVGWAVLLGSLAIGGLFGWLTSPAGPGNSKC
jgi:hypothetical protein